MDGLTDGPKLHQERPHSGQELLQLVDLSEIACTEESNKCRNGIVYGEFSVISPAHPPLGFFSTLVSLLTSHSLSPMNYDNTMIVEIYGLCHIAHVLSINNTTSAFVTPVSL